MQVDDLVNPTPPPDRLAGVDRPPPWDSPAVCMHLKWNSLRAFASIGKIVFNRKNGERASQVSLTCKFLALSRSLSYPPSSFISSLNLLREPFDQSVFTVEISISISANMSFFTILRSLPVVCLLLSVAAAQTCYYPDGLTVSQDIPCNTDASASSCCPSDSFCMDNGLCFGGGVVSRASCTDQSWESEQCADYCKTGKSMNMV